MHSVELVMWALIILAAIVSVWSVRWQLRRFYARGCTGSKWRRRFPDAPKDEIRAFLQLFVDAFALDPKKALTFSPDDKVGDVYQALYPLKGMADAMEMEMLIMRCEERYGVDMAKMWRADATLGDLFREVRKTA